MTSLLFVALASPHAFAFTNGLGLVATLEKNGATPSTYGLLLHGAVFFLVLFYAGRQ
jgi:hypothetical protein